jgi:hypothetical protein
MPERAKLGFYKDFTKIRFAQSLEKFAEASGKPDERLEKFVNGLGKLVNGLEKFIKTCCKLARTLESRRSPVL